MKALIRFATSLVFGVGVSAVSAAADGLVLPENALPGLDGILKAAVQQSPRMLNRALELEIAENNRLMARSNILPSLSSSFSYYKASDDRADLPERQDVTKVAYNVTLSQPIFHWGERRNNVRMGVIQQKIAQGQYRDGYRLLVQELRNNYMRLIGQKIGLKRARYNQEFTAKQLRQEEERLQKKVISEVEIAAARLTAEQAQIASDRADFDYQNAKLSFARLAGMGTIADEAIPDAIPATAYVPEPFDRLLAGFLNQKDLPTVDAFVLRQQLQIESLNYANQKTRLRPKFSAILATNQDEQSYTANVALKYKVNSIYAGVSVYWTIFDGFAARSATRNSLARRRQMDNDYQQLTERLAQDAQNQVKLIGFSARNMSIYDRFLNRNESNLTSMQEQFRLGVRSEADVSMAQIHLYDSQINAINARNDYFMRIGDFLGTIMEDPALFNLPAK